MDWDDVPDHGGGCDSSPKLRLKLSVRVVAMILVKLVGLVLGV